MSHYNRDYITRIRQMGYRMTPQRQLILDTVCEKGDHLTAGEIYELIQVKAPEVNQATVYRALDFFCELNLIARTEIAGRSLYEIVTETPHHHLVCRRCGRVAALGNHHFDALAEHLLKEYGFQAELSHLAISGLCAECMAEAGA